MPGVGAAPRPAGPTILSLYGVSLVPRGPHAAECPLPKLFSCRQPHPLYLNGKKLVGFFSRNLDKGVFGETRILDVFTCRVTGRDGGSECQGGLLASSGGTGPCGRMGGPATHRAGGVPLYFSLTKYIFFILRTDGDMSCHRHSSLKFR